jgi:hypothetical protein
MSESYPNPQSAERMRSGFGFLRMLPQPMYGHGTWLHCRALARYNIDIYTFVAVQISDSRSQRQHGHILFYFLFFDSEGHLNRRS